MSRLTPGRAQDAQALAQVSSGCDQARLRYPQVCSGLAQDAHLQLRLKRPLLTSGD